MFGGSGSPSPQVSARSFENREPRTARTENREQDVGSGLNEGAGPMESLGGSGMGLLGSSDVEGGGKS